MTLKWYETTSLVDRGANSVMQKAEKVVDVIERRKAEIEAKKTQQERIAEARRKASAAAIGRRAEARWQYEQQEQAQQEAQQAAELQQGVARAETQQKMRDKVVQDLYKQGTITAEMAPTTIELFVQEETNRRKSLEALQAGNYEDAQRYQAYADHVMQSGYTESPYKTSWQPEGPFEQAWAKAEAQPQGPQPPAEMTGPEKAVRGFPKMFAEQNIPFMRALLGKEETGTLPAWLGGSQAPTAQAQPGTPTPTQPQPDWMQPASQVAVTPRTPEAAAALSAEAGRPMRDVFSDIREHGAERVGLQGADARRLEWAVNFMDKMKPVSVMFHPTHMAGWGNVYTSLGGAASWAGKEGLGRTLTGAGTSLQEMKEPKDWERYTEKELLLKPEWYADKILETVPFMEALIPATIAGIYGGGAIAGAMGLGAWGTAIVTAGVGAAAQRPIESLMEAGGTYNEAKRRGLTREEANTAAGYVFKRNMTLVGLDALQWASILVPKPAGSGILLNSAIRAGALAGNILSEGGEEAIQEVINRRALGDKVQWDRQMREAATIGGIMGGLFYGGGEAVVSMARNANATVAEMQDETVRELSPELKGVYDTTLAEEQAAGADPRVAKIKALDAVAETEEGAEITKRLMGTLHEVLAAKQAEEYAKAQEPTKPEKPRAPRVKAAPAEQAVAEAPIAEAIPEPIAPVVKEPWEMTRAEFENEALTDWFKGKGWINKEQQLINMREEVVRDAIAEGKPVPPEVLKDYPDLAKAAPVEAVAEKVAPAPKPAGEGVVPSFEQVKGTQDAMLGVAPQEVAQKKAWTAGQMEMGDYTKYQEAMKPKRVLTRDDADLQTEALDMKAEDVGRRINEAQAIVEELEDYIAQNQRLFNLVEIIPRNREGAHELTHITKAKFRKHMGYEAPDNILTTDGKHVKWEYALDKLAGELHMEGPARAAGMNHDEYVKDQIEQAQNHKELLELTRRDMVEEEAIFANIERLKAEIDERVQEAGGEAAIVMNEAEWTTFTQEHPTIASGEWFGMGDEVEVTGGKATPQPEEWGHFRQLVEDMVAQGKRIPIPVLNKIRGEPSGKAIPVHIREIQGMRGKVEASIEELTGSLETSKERGLLRKMISNAKKDLKFYDRLTKALEREGLKTPKVKKLRSTIMAWGRFKGLPETHQRELFKKVGGRLQLKNMDEAALEKVLKAMKTARPVTINHRTVITRKTEGKIASLRSTLTRKGQMTDTDFVKLMGELGLKTTKYESQYRFITESEGKAMTQAMNDEAPVIKGRILDEKGLAKQPDAAAQLEELEANIVASRSGKKLGGFPDIYEKDIRVTMGDWQNETGAPFFDIAEEMLNAKRIGEYETKKLHDALMASTPEAKAIIDSEAAQDRVRQWIAAKNNMGPKKPEDISPEEVKFADAVETHLRGYQSDAKYRKFDEAYEIRGGDPAKMKEDYQPGTPIKELRRAVDIYESEGAEALRAFLDTRSWGIVQNGYEPLMNVAGPVIHQYHAKPGAVGAGHVKRRQGLFYPPQDAQIVQRLFSYTDQMQKGIRMQPLTRRFIRTFNNNTESFGDPAGIANDITLWLESVAGQYQYGGRFNKLVLRGYSQVAAAVFANPTLWVRNLGQNIALHPDRLDLIDPRNEALTPDQALFTDIMAGQLQALRADFFLQTEKPLPFLGKATRFLNKFNLYSKTDTPVNRYWAMWGSLNKANRAMKVYQKERAAEIAVGNPDSTKAFEKLLKESGFYHLERQAQARALKQFARDEVDYGVSDLALIPGPEAFNRYIGNAVVAMVHYRYAQVERSLGFQGSGGRVWGSLSVFPRGTIQRMHLRIRKLDPKYKASHTEKKQAAYDVAKVVLYSFLAGKILSHIFGKDRNPYDIRTMVVWGFGGLSVSAALEFGDCVEDIYTALTMGDEKAAYRVTSSIPRVAKMLIPFLRVFIQEIEAVTQTKNLDRLLLRELLAIIDKNYDVNRSAYQTDRTLIESAQHFVFGGGDTQKASGEQNRIAKLVFKKSYDDLRAEQKEFVDKRVK